MPRPLPDPADDAPAIERAIARVLDAEVAARSSVDAARAAAAASAEAARAEAQAVAARADRRLRALRDAFERRTSGEVAALDAAAAEAGAAHALGPDDLERVDAAVAALAARLTGGAA